MKILLFSLLLLVSSAMSCEAQLREVRYPCLLMGSSFLFTARHESDSTAWQATHAAEAEVKRIEALISSWDPHSETSQLNKLAGKDSLQVSPELFQLITRCKKLSVLTQGAFDISFAGVSSLFQFDRGEHPLAADSLIRQSVAKVGYQHIQLTAHTGRVYLALPGMRIGFGAIGKGYAANRAKQVMQAYGIKHGIVNAGGDLLAWGEAEAHTPWKIGIADPFQRKKMAAWLKLSDLAVVSSGNYEKYFTFQGKRYGHIIDPRSGYPAQGLSSVSVVCPDAELADGLATAIYVLGAEAGLNLLNQLNQVEGLLITSSGEIISSEHLDLSFYQE